MSYRVKTAEGPVYALRVSSGMNIRRASAYSVEAAWIDGLSDNPWFRIPRVARTTDGACIATVLDDQSVPRASTLLTWIEGRRCFRIGSKHARALGQMVGALHLASQGAAPPPRGAIKSWDATLMCGGRKDALHRFCTDAIGLVGDVYSALAQVMSGIEQKEKGLINADLGLHNVLFYEGRGAGLVDFNDSGIGPYAFCLSRLLERIRLMDRGEALVEEILNGYSEVTPLPSAFKKWGGLLELAAAVFKLNFGAQRADSRGTTLERREQETIRRLRRMLDSRELSGATLTSPHRA